jgi:hypothetical protein
VLFSCQCPLCDEDPAHKDLQDHDERTKQDIRRIHQEMIKETVT